MSATAEVSWQQQYAPLVDRPHIFKRLLLTARSKKVGTFGLALIFVVVFIALLGPLLSPYSKDELFTTPNPDFNPRSFDAKALNPTRPAVLLGPSWEHPLGTDNIGRDLMTRVFEGARLSIVVGLTSAAIATVIGTTLGIVSGYRGGWIDMILQRVVDAFIVIPGIILLLLLVQIKQGSLFLTIVALGFSGIWGTARVVRSAALVVRSEVYCECAQAIGAGPTRIMTFYVLPNVVGPVIVAFTVGIGGNILAEAGLAFLNLSVDGPTWGKMVNDGRAYLVSKPMMSIVGGGAITLTVLGFNLFGDALRDILDPRQRGAR